MEIRKSHTNVYSAVAWSHSPCTITQSIDHTFNVEIILQLWTSNPLIYISSDYMPNCSLFHINLSHAGGGHFWAYSLPLAMLFFKSLHSRPVCFLQHHFLVLRPKEPGLWMCEICPYIPRHVSALVTHTVYAYAQRFLLLQTCIWIHVCFTCSNACLCGHFHNRIC